MNRAVLYLERTWANHRQLSAFVLDFRQVALSRYDSDSIKTTGVENRCRISDFFTILLKVGKGWAKSEGGGGAARSGRLQ